jgi:hypothetical protein
MSEVYLKYALQTLHSVRYVGSAGVHLGGDGRRSRAAHHLSPSRPEVPVMSQAPQRAEQPRLSKSLLDLGPRVARGRVRPPGAGPDVSGSGRELDPQLGSDRTHRWRSTHTNAAGLSHHGGTGACGELSRKPVQCGAEPNQQSGGKDANPPVATHDLESLRPGGRGAFLCLQQGCDAPMS